MTESKSSEYEIPWQWANEQLKEKIRKNKHIVRLRNDLKYKSKRVG